MMTFGLREPTMSRTALPFVMSHCDSLRAVKFADSFSNLLMNARASWPFLPVIRYFIRGLQKLLSAFRKSGCVLSLAERMGSVTGHEIWISGSFQMIPLSPAGEYSSAHLYITSP